MSAYSDTLRYIFSSRARERDHGLTTPDGIEVHKDIPYAFRGEHREWQLMDVYLPTERTEEKLPVIISVHGGGWVQGDKEEYRYYCMSLAGQGFGVINFSYRLAPEYHFPAPLEDLSSVIGWLTENAKSYGMDIDRVCAVGDSAGGQILSLYVALLTGDDRPDRIFETVEFPENFHFRALGFNCATLRISSEKNMSSMERHQIEDYLGYTPDDEAIAVLNAQSYLGPGFPPSYLLTCEGDFLKGQPAIFAETLEAYDIPHVIHMCGTKEAPLTHGFFIDVKSDTATAENSRELDFFRRYI